MSTRYVRNYGHTDIALATKNPRRSAEFYAGFLDSHTVHDFADFVQIERPGARGITFFEPAAKDVGRLGKTAHFGFRLGKADDVATAAEAVMRAGGEIIEQGELSPGEPYLFAKDPDGYLFEVWYEPVADA